MRRGDDGGTGAADDVRATGDVPRKTCFDATLHESGSIASRNDSAAMTVDGGRTGDGRATAADGCGDDGGDDDMRAPERRVPCGGAFALSIISPRLGNRHDDRRDGRRDGRRTGDGRADGVVVRERRIGVGGSGGRRALTVGTTGVEGV